MSISPSGNHHRRRSSVLTGNGGAPPQTPIEQRADGFRSIGEGAGYKREEQKSSGAEDTDVSDLSSIAESAELNYQSSDDEYPDEEAGLTTNQRRQRRRRQKKRKQLYARLSDVKATWFDPFSLFSISSADRTVIHRLLVNASLILLWYIFSLSISIYNKWMFSQDDVVFPFPLFTTSLHMAVQFMLSCLILYFIPALRPQPPASSTSGSPVRHDVSDSRPVLTKLFYLTRLVPCGAATSLDIGLGNMSLKFITLTFLTMCKSSALAFVLLFAFIFRLETPSVRLIVIIITMSIGVVMMVAGETAFNVVGFALVIASAFFSGFRWGLTQILLLRHPATANPFSTLFFLTPVMFVSLAIMAWAVEGPSEILAGYTALADAHGSGFSIMLLIFPGVLAFCMIASEFTLLKRSSVVTLSICGIFKEVVTISAAGIVFDDKLTAINIVGLAITIGSIATYNYMKISKMRAEAQRSTWETHNLDSDDGSTHGAYQQVSNPETSMVHSSDLQMSENVNITPARDSTAGRSFPALTGGTSSNVPVLSINTSNLSGDGRVGPYSPRVSGPSTLRSAPPMIVSMETELQQARGRGLSASGNLHFSSERGSPAESS